MNSWVYLDVFAGNAAPEQLEGPASSRLRLHLGWAASEHLDSIQFSLTNLLSRSSRVLQAAASVFILSKLLVSKKGDVDYIQYIEHNEKVQM